MTATQQHSGTAQSEPTLRERYEAVCQRVAQAAARSGRTAADVHIVAVTKNASIDQIRQLIDLGHVDLGENRVQQLVQRAALIDEFLNRRRELPSAARKGAAEGVRWHMIGHVQRNKVRKLLGVVRLIHSIDSLRLVEELHALAIKREEPTEVLVQVNVAGEEQKYGIVPAAARHMVEQIETMVGLKSRGLMCMAPLVDDPETVRPVFERCRELFEDIRTSGAGGDRFDILSMGMSTDYEVAIECGANIVRIGSAIFGPPQHDDDHGGDDDDGPDEA